MIKMWLPFTSTGFETAFVFINTLYRWIYIIIKTLPRDLRGLTYFMKFYILQWKCVNDNSTVPKVFSSLVQKYPQKVVFYFEDEAWTYAKVDEFSNKIARYFLNCGFQKGDTIALLLENCIEYPCIWLGLSKIGLKTALINTNVVKESLLHSINITKCKSVIFGSNLAQSIQDISSSLTSLKQYQFQEHGNVGNLILEGCIDLRKELDTVSGKTIKENNLKIKHDDPVLYIYTSGTTGLPKAAVITHYRCIMLANTLKILGFVLPEDIFYTPLPLYHSAGGLMGAGQALLSGTTVALRKKFSATQYFKDCEKYNATVAQYIGEICRYILATQPNGPVKHKLRGIVGNGLRPQIWKPFITRFGIKNVFEFYGATEGVSNLANIDNTEGSVGFMPQFFRRFFPMKLIKCNELTGAPIRNSEGLCIQCGVEEPGLMIGKIKGNENFFKYDGYTDSESSEKKIIHDVICKGDRYFNSGDILVSDQFGNCYFKDRTGDTFRWKGENVSTSEVEAVISNIMHLNDVIVYGVKVPDSEGNAGMAAILDTEKTFNIDSIAAAFRDNLPAYAIPIFIRVLDSVPLTGTFKLKKTELREEGYNIDKIENTIYFLHPQHKKYVNLTNDIYKDILEGKMRL